MRSFKSFHSGISLGEDDILAIFQLFLGLKNLWKVNDLIITYDVILEIKGIEREKSNGGS